jgi:hypothetical protein
MDSNNNTFINYIFKFLGYFYKPTNLQPTNPAEKYIQNYKAKNKFKKLPLLYTNPKWDSEKKKLIFNSFDQELELAKKKTYV